MSLTLTSLPENYRALVFGAGGAIGGAFARALGADPRCGALFTVSRRPQSLSGARALTADFAEPDSIEAAARAAAKDGPLHLVIAATGVLHDGAELQPEKSWRDLDAERLAELMRINLIGPALIARHTLDHLARGSRDAPQKAVWAALSARVGSISDNQLGGWHGYRASKAALNQLIRTLSIELARKAPGAVCAGLHPGTVDTALSAPFQRSVPEGKLFTPGFAAESLLGVIDALTPADTGQVFDWAGEAIAP
ncbi:SDR family NAD(P)-dependent oxidoreductase [Alkalicaulis satelles]|uniref:SDR family NAD(P)-dependent oxidoreductase n=1 Tax=Alkalicaulis satelles TaxID=2609175 RepID=A0A5M6ZFC4_9PROT|nr:SDR family NAD(P)-dependent oxidoreductase [Alkalicaulis satelles]KAA5803446.1 SDR family NAD(P)-dependent oxidoreductase [Alkalicaulis satelles]